MCQMLIISQRNGIKYRNFALHYFGHAEFNYEVEISNFRNVTPPAMLNGPFRLKMPQMGKILIISQRNAIKSRTLYLD